MAHARFKLGPLVLAAACLLGALPAQAATVAFYRFENGTDGQAARGKGSILDSSGNGLDGTPFGKPRYEAVSNPDSTLALRFNGRTAGVFVPDNPLFELTHSLTLEAYVYRRAGSKGGGIVARSDDRYDFDPYYISLLHDGILAFLIEQDVGFGTYILSPTPLPVGQWVHVAGTLDDASGLQAIYVNGVMVASQITSIRPFAKLKANHHPGLAIAAGIRGSPDMGYVRIAIDELRISDVALDPSEFLPPP